MSFTPFLSAAFFTAGALLSAFSIKTIESRSLNGGDVLFFVGDGGSPKLI
jgi:hypothetical protein